MLFYAQYTAEHVYFMYYYFMFTIKACVYMVNNRREDFSIGTRVFHAMVSPNTWIG